MERIPIYLIALIVALAHMGTNIYDVHAWNLGTVKAEPWRSKVSTGARRVTSAVRAFWQTLWCHRRGLAVAGLLALVVFAPSVLYGHGDNGGGAPIAFSMAVGLEDLKAEYRQALEWLKQLQSRGVDAGTIQDAAKKCLDLKGRLASAQGDANFTDELDRLTGGMMPSRGGNASGGRGGNASGGRGRSLGDQILASETGQWLVNNRGKFPSGAWTSPASEIMAATLTSDPASGGDLIITDYQAGILPLPTRPLVVADLIAPGTTTSNTVGYMKETTATNAAATVAEGAAKPESTLIFDAVTDPVRKIATWLPVTDEMFEDVPALRGYIDTRLRHFVQLAEDDQLLNGDGVAPNISGLLDRPGIAAPIARVAQSNPDVILEQISAIETATLMVVDGLVIHPANWLSMLLLKSADGKYIAGGGPFETPQRKTLWGLPVAVTPAITINTALIGAFRTASQFFRKGGLRVEASSSHADYWIKNLIAVRAETRGALCVYRESAFGLVTNLT
jgi:HK97 family phage major capsid protein